MGKAGHHIYSFNAIQETAHQTKSYPGPNSNIRNHSNSLSPISEPPSSSSCSDSKMRILQRAQVPVDVCKVKEGRNEVVFDGNILSFHENAF